jgi:hypothetical protein
MMTFPGAHQGGAKLIALLNGERRVEQPFEELSLLVDDGLRQRRMAGNRQLIASLRLWRKAWSFAVLFRAQDKRWCADAHTQCKSNGQPTTE